MKPEILYVELIDDTSHKGPAWIGYGYFNRTRKTLYFNGRILRKGRGIISNYIDILSNEGFWVSSVKKNGEDRHWAGSGKITIDETAIEEYLKIIDEFELPKNKFLVSQLNNIPKVELANQLENQILTND